jgi:hypothetical protein
MARSKILNLPQELDLLGFELIEGVQALEIVQKWLCVFALIEQLLKELGGGSLMSGTRFIVSFKMPTLSLNTKNTLSLAAF